MGHTYLGGAGSSASSREVAGLLNEGAGAPRVAEAAFTAANRAFEQVQNDFGFREAVWIMAQFGIAGTKPDPVQHLESVGIEVKDANSVAEVSKAAEWETREQTLRETEWAMHERAIAAAKRGLDAYMEREKVYANLADIARMLEIASKLGRLATGLGTDGERRMSDNLPTVRVEVSVALDKIYGEPLPGEVLAPPAIVDVEAMPSLPERT